MSYLSNNFLIKEDESIDKSKLQSGAQTGSVIGGTIGGVAATMFGLPPQLGKVAGNIAGGAAGLQTALIIETIKRQHSLSRNDMVDVDNKEIKRQLNFSVNENYQHKGLFKAKEGLISNDLSLGGKLVEVEKNEMVFRQNKDDENIIELIHSFENDRTHKDGGRNYVIQAGDIVFPRKLKKQLESIIDENGFIKDVPKFRELRNTLPKEEIPNALKQVFSVLGNIPGTDASNVERVKGKGGVVDENAPIVKYANGTFSVSGLPELAAMIGVNTQNIFKNQFEKQEITQLNKISNNKPVYENPLLNVDSKNEDNKLMKFLSKKFSFSDLGKSKDSLNNNMALLYSMLSNSANKSSNVEVRKATEVNFDKYQQFDNSAALRSQLLGELKTASNQVALNTGGNSAALLGNLANLQTNTNKALTDVNNAVTERAYDINNKNTELSNRGKELNASYFDANVTANEQNRAADLNYKNSLKSNQLSAINNFLQNRDKITKNQNSQSVNELELSQKAIADANHTKMLKNYLGVQLFSNEYARKEFGNNKQLQQMLLQMGFSQDELNSYLK